MPTNHASFTNEYLQSTRAVLQAGKQLRNVLGKDRETVNFAIAGLERAAQRHDRGGAEYHDFMFTAEQDAPPSDKAVPERVTEDVLASVLTDMQVANVLMAAGQALGETGQAAQATVLDEAILRLENTATAVERSLPDALTRAAEPGRFGFAGDVTSAKAPQSADLPSPIESFRQRGNETLTALVNDAEGVVTNVITALSKLDTDKVLEALSKLGDQIHALPEIGRLLRWGVEKLRAAITSLIQLLSSGALTRIKNHVEKIWQDVKEGKYATQTLEWAFDVEVARSHIGEILHAAGLQRESLDEGSNALTALAVRFKENMAMVRGLTSAVTVATTVLALTPLAGPELVLFAASGYAVILAGVVLIGMDYADSGRILQRVRGVRRIADSVGPRNLGGSHE